MKRAGTVGHFKLDAWRRSNSMANLVFMQQSVVGTPLMGILPKFWHRNVIPCVLAVLEANISTYLVLFGRATGAMVIFCPIGSPAGERRTLCISWSTCSCRNGCGRWQWICSVHAREHTSAWYTWCSPATSMAMMSTWKIRIGNSINASAGNALYYKYSNLRTTEREKREVQTYPEPLSKACTWIKRQSCASYAWFSRECSIAWYKEDNTYHIHVGVNFDNVNCWWR